MNHLVMKIYAELSGETYNLLQIYSTSAHQKRSLNCVNKTVHEIKCKVGCQRFRKPETHE